jgi:hypothetical protein
MSPTEQIKKRLRDTKSEDITERQFFEDKFREYKEFLEFKGNMKPSTIKVSLSPVASFFGRNGLLLQ